MTADILTFDPNKNNPHRSGPAKCTRCEHEWVAVCAEEDRKGPFECPKCHLMSGHYHGFAPAESELCYKCDCGSEIYYVLWDEVLCVGCGGRTSFMELAAAQE